MGQQIKAFVLLVLMALLGCGHLLVPDHYFLINYDSFHFHHLARMLASGESVKVIGSGLAYPIAWMGNLVGLDTAAMMLPPLLGALTGLALYYGVSRLYSTKIALYTVACFVFAQIPRFVFLSGNIDRDGLHMLIMTLGILGLAFYLKTQRRDCLALTLLTIPLLYVEWGPMALLQYIPALVGTVVLSVEVYQSKWTWVWVGLLAVGAYLVGRAAIHFVASVDVSELAPFNVYSLIQYTTIAIPFAFGIKTVLNRKGDAVLLAWLLSFILMGFCASRLAIYAVVPACIIGGIGIDALRTGITIWGMNKEWRLLCVVAAAIFTGLSWVIPANIKMNNDWYDALTWVKENTPERSEVASWWSYGYWIEDVGDRPAKQTIGMVNSMSADMADFYCAPSEAKAREIMVSRGWDYVMLSTREENFMGSITKRASVPDPVFYYQAIGDTDLAEIERVYQNKTVVILTP